ncbi:hypothetical protein GCM10027056_20720 [Glaciibacter psychrotolerans]
MVATGAFAATPAVAGTSPAAAALSAASTHQIAPLAAPEVTPAFKALVFSKTAGFRHTSIEAGTAAIKQLGVDNGFDVDSTEDATAFTEANLAQYDVVIWLSTTGDVLDATQQAAFEHYIEGGGGYAGIHAAADTEYDWPWYADLVGAQFSNHPANQNATIKVEDRAHPSTAFLDQTWDRYDEWYAYRENPRTSVHVLASVDEKSYSGGTMGVDHPIAWCQNYDGGRSWYTGGGHVDENYADPQFLEHLLGGIRTASGDLAADCSATDEGSFDMVALDDNTSNPMMLDVAPNGDVFYAERDGRVMRIDSTTTTTSTALTLNVFTANEDGLQGLVLDPDFATNNWVYVYWSPANVESYGPHNKLSRFSYDPATKSIVPSTEKSILRVPVQRDNCCHVGGDMVFDAEGNLILVTGDNSNPFESSGFTPIDERPGRSDFDAQRTSANTNDLRGKVLRITPHEDGSYTVPAGNLFDEAADSTDKTKPEIYAMGFRNPFRIGIDEKTNALFVADFGPDAGSASSSRGPGGTVEWNIIKEPGNYGWPYCAGIKCFNDYNFANEVSGPKFNPQALVNTSPNNTGLTNLPPMVDADWWTENGATPIYTEIGVSGAPMGGPIYHYDENLDSDVKWPEYWDGKVLFGEWNQGKMYSFQLDEATSSTIFKVNRALPGIFDPAAGFNRMMDFDFGPDGSLYAIDWGSGFGGNNADSGIYKINYNGGNPAPIAHATADVTNGPAPLTVKFSSEGTRHPTSNRITLEWSFGDGSPAVTEANPTHVYADNGQYTAQLTVTDEDDGQISVANVVVVVGNEVPSVSIDFPDNGGFFEWGDQVAYSVTVNDPDGAFDCANVSVHPALGHDAHAHPMEALQGCEGVLQTSRDDGHGAEANIFWVIDARYTDDGGAAGIPLTGYALGVLQPKRVQSEFFTSTGRIGGTGSGDDGVRVESTSDVQGGGSNIGYVEPNDWWAHEPVSLKNVDSISLRAASGNAAGAKLSVRWGSPTGTELGQVTVPNTGDWQRYGDFPLDIPSNAPTGSGGLFFVLLSGGINVNWLTINGRGVTDNVRPDLAVTYDKVSGGAPLTVVATSVSHDPDGDSAKIVTTWNQGTGDGFIVGAASNELVYTEPGTYLLTVRATDERGAYAEKKQTITVIDGGPARCFAGRSDDFTGTTLDEDRWDTIIRRDQTLVVKDGNLVIPVSKTDINGAANAGAKNIVLQDLPAGAWEATTKVAVPLRAGYQQAGLMIYGDDDNYAKMVIIARNAAGESPNERYFQYIREEAGNSNEGIASNTGRLSPDFPDTAYLRLTSDGTNLTAAYSEDGVAFTAMPETKQLAGITNPKIGLFAAAGTGSKPAVINAEFDWFTITPDDTAGSAVPNDEFDGTGLDACRWTVLNEDRAGYRVADGQLAIDTTPTDIYEASNSTVPNIVVQPQPSPDWTVETKVDASTFDRKYHQGGLILYGNEDNYVKLTTMASNNGGAALTRVIELRSESGGVIAQPQPQAAVTGGTYWLRLSKVGSVFTGSFSEDGVTWSVLDAPVVNSGLNAASVGLFALGAEQTKATTAKFDHFRVIAAPLRVSGVLSPGAPTGTNGWYTNAVSLTVAAEGGTGTVYREYKLDGAANWFEYTSPVIVQTDGDHSIAYRASAQGATTDPQMVSFKIDRLAPVPVATLTVDPSDATLRTVAITATDATSGVASIEYRTDGGDWIAYSAVIPLTANAQTVTYRAQDAAGNLSSESTLQVASVGEPEATVLTVTGTLSPATPNGANGWYTNSVDVSATGTSTVDGVVTVEYSTDGSVFTTLTGTVTLSSEGPNSVWLRAKDSEDNRSEPKRFDVKIDSVVPTATAALSDARVITLEAADETSSIARIEYRLSTDAADASWRVYSGGFSASDAAMTVSYRGVDAAGNVGDTGVLAVDAAPAVPATPALVVDDTTLVVGGLVRVNGTGFTAGDDVEIWFYSDPQLVTTVTVNEQGGFARTIQVPATVSPGTHHLRALINGAVVASSVEITVSAVPVGPGPGDGGGNGPGNGPGSGNGAGGSATGSLAETGAEGWQSLIPLALILLFAGLVGVVISKHRRAGASTS